jgi:predicted NAD/FAD-binding protein
LRLAEDGVSEISRAALMLARVIGAGVAGLCAAYALAGKAWT